VAALAFAAGLVAAGTFVLSQRPGTTGGGSPRPGSGAATRIPAQGRSSPPGTESPASSGPAIGGRWHLAFADEFSGPALDASRWVTCYDWNVSGCTNAGNHESQWYLPGQVSVASDTATLTAQRRPTHGSDGKVYPWASGMLSTGRSSWTGRPRFAFTYGYLEARIRMPSEQGMFPAFWLLAADERADAEIDVVEMIGTHTSALMNLHWIAASGAKVQAPRTFGPIDYSAGYHDFAVDWEPGSVTWYIDGVARDVITNSRTVPSVPMEIICTLAVGIPHPPPPSVTSGSMSIAWVRLWQR
jgi:beta-glucanase (GH16 family)